MTCLSHIDGPECGLPAECLVDIAVFGDLCGQIPMCLAHAYRERDRINVRRAGLVVLGWRLLRAAERP